MLSAQIKQKAKALGFDKIAIARADALTEEGARLREWLSRGYHGEMKWMEREPEKRSDPRILLPEAKSVIVVLLNYFTDSLGSLGRKTQGQSPRPEDLDSIPKTQNPKPKISKYALGSDYHDVVGEKLKELAAFIKELDPTAEVKPCVDTAPIMDKAWAVRAGLGWMGKHTNLITRELGSWVFIGEIVTNLELDYDEAVEKDRCGTCTACIDACPTQAITEAYLVDSNRCISYATIELREPELPREIAENLQGWIYGCDICQDVCPWNRFEKPTDEAGFTPRKENLAPDLDEILSMTQEQFSETFRGSAIKRTKLSGLQRNAKAIREKS